MKRSEFQYITLDEVKNIHLNVLIGSKESKAIKYLDRVTTTLEFVQNEDYYPFFLDKLSYLIFSFVKNHYFFDGNKRTGLVVGTVFVANNLSIDAANIFIDQMEDVVVNLADNNQLPYTQSDLKLIIEAILVDEIDRIEILHDFKSLPKATQSQIIEDYSKRNFSVIQEKSKVKLGTK